MINKASGLRKVETKEHRTFEIRGDKLDAAKHLKIILSEQAHWIKHDLKINKLILLSGKRVSSTESRGILVILLFYSKQQFELRP